MPKLILCCSYLKNAPSSHLQNFVQYIGTCEGVEKVSDTTALLPATVKQKELIQDILNRIEDADRMHEYYDYLQKPTRENALEFITQALENNLDTLVPTNAFVLLTNNIFPFAKIQCALFKGTERVVFILIRGTLKVRFMNR